jgi:CheY-like chemotaxis protein
MNPAPLKTILIVDDDQDILTLVRFSLEDHTELSISYVSSGQEALQKALKEKPNLILLDIMMPGMSGIETLQAFQLIPELSSIPVIFFSAKAQRAEISYYLTLGALGVIVKPFDPMMLYEQIMQYWKKAETDEKTS